MASLIQDIRFSVRLIRKRPGVALLIVTALGLGIGLNAAIFSVFNAVVLRPLPIFQPDRVVWLFSKISQTGARLGTSYPDYLDWKSQSSSFETMAAFYSLSFTLTGDGPAEHLKAAGVSASAFKTWGVSTILGRDFTDNDDRTGANRVVILNYSFWQRKFGGDPAVLGKTLVLDDQQYNIVGVLQPTPLGVLKYPDVYVANGPLINSHIMERDTRYFFPVARLKPHVTQAQAQAEMDTIAARLAAEYPATNKDMGISIQGMVEQLTADGRKPLSLLIVASSLIFLLAAVNVMTAFIAATAERRQELATRLALGATPAALLRQLFVQALMIGSIGGALGLLLAKLTLAFFLHRFPAAFQRFQETTVDSSVFLISLVMALLASVVVTLLSGVYVSRLRANDKLTGERISFALSRNRRLGRAALIIFEVSLASALSLVCGLLIKSFYEVEKVDLGFSPSHIYSFQVNPPLTRYKDPDQLIALYQAAFNTLSNLPGMHSTSAISSLPLTTQGWVNTVEVDAQSPLFGQKVTVEDESILPGFFEAMRLPLLRGRDFRDADQKGAPPVVIVDNVLADKLWPGKDPLGQRLRMSTQTGGQTHWLEVIGVVQQIKHFGPERPARWSQLYVAQYQDPFPVLSFVINTDLPESAVRAATTKALHELNKDLPIENFETMDAYLDTILGTRKLSLLLFSIFASIAVLLGMIGIYGVVANSVIQRRREIAIRMAVGATPKGAIFLVTRLGLLATLAGVLLGSAIVVSLTRVLASFLFGITALDPKIYALTGVVLILLAVVAGIIPAIRLLRFNIQEILRQ